MARYIDADKAISEMRELKRHNYAKGLDGTMDEDDVIQFIADQATEDVSHVVHGRWIFLNLVGPFDDEYEFAKCSACGKSHFGTDSRNYKKFPYCHCGAKMDLEPIYD